MDVCWDWFSLMLYAFVASIGVVCLNNYENKNLKIAQLRISGPMLIMFLSWVSFAAFRYIGNNDIGGTDAHSYIEYFATCLSSNQSRFSYRAEIGFRLFTKLIRIFTDNYKIYLILIYSIIVFSYLYFIKEFKDKYSSGALYSVAFFYYLMSFNTIRSSLAAAFLLIGFTLLKKRYYLRAIIIGTTSIFFHKSLFFYLGFYIFWYVYRKKKPTIKKSLVISLVGFIIGVIIQRLILSGKLFLTIGTPINVYASYSVRSGFFEHYWKIVISQLCLIILIILFRKRLFNYSEKFDSMAKSKFDFIYLACLYDLILIPFLSVLHIWRGIEYFFWPRLILWGYLINAINLKVSKNGRNIVLLISLISGYLYMIFRIYTQYDMSGLMPYIFAPLYNPLE